MGRVSAGSIHLRYASGVLTCTLRFAKQIECKPREDPRRASVKNFLAGLPFLVQADQTAVSILE